MARVSTTAKPNNAAYDVSATAYNAFVGDYVSQTDNNTQSLASDINLASTKQIMSNSVPLRFGPKFKVTKVGTKVHVQEDNCVNVISKDDVEAALNDEVFAGLTAGRTWRETVWCQGEFSVPDTILIPAYTHIYGGKYTAATNLNKSMFTTEHYNSTNDFCIRIEGLYIDGNYSNVASSNGIMFGSRRSLIHDCIITNCKGYPLYIGGASYDFANRVNDWAVVNCRIIENLYGLYVGNYAYDGAITDLRSGDNGNYQLAFLAGGSPVSAINTHVWTSWGDACGILIKSSEIKLVNPEVENVQAHGIVIEGDSNVTSTANIAITGGEIYDCGYQTDNTYDAINVTGVDATHQVDWLKITGTKIFNWAQANNHRYGINIANEHVDYTDIQGVQIRGSGTDDTPALGGGVGNQVKNYFDNTTWTP